MVEAVEAGCMYAITSRTLELRLEGNCKASRFNCNGERLRNGGPGTCLGLPSSGQYEDTLLKDASLSFPLTRHRGHGRSMDVPCPASRGPRPWPASGRGENIPDLPAIWVTLQAQGQLSTGELGERESLFTVMGTAACILYISSTAP